MFPDLITRLRHYDILAKTRSRMTMATKFSRQNDAGPRARTTGLGPVYMEWGTPA